MAKKKVVKIIKLQIPAGKANPAPPIGPALGSAGVNIMAFCKEYNAKTQDRQGMDLPVVITVYSDKSFEFITKEPPAAWFIKNTLKIEKGSGTPNRNMVGTLTLKQVEEIAKKKYPDLAVRSLDSAMKMIMGTAKSMGVQCESA